MTNDRVRELFAKCISFQDENKLELAFETEEEADEAAEYILQLGNAVEPGGELADDINGRACELAFNTIEHQLGHQTAHLTPAEQYNVFKRVARSCERTCDEMVREAASQLNRTGDA